jgi:hypothetical protein
MTAAVCPIVGNPDEGTPTFRNPGFCRYFGGQDVLP